MTTQQVLDKQGLQHYATKMCNAENRKVGSKSLPTALNDIDTAIDGFKTLFNNEYGTPVTATIKNNSNSFTVGTGKGIDKSNEVENSFTDIELSGNSIVNIYNGVREISSSVNSVNNFATITNIKPNTQYTIKYAVKSSNKLTSPSLTSFFRIQACDKNNNPINEWLFGVSHNVETSYTYHTAIFNTPSELSNIVLTIRNCYSEWNLQSNTSYIKDIIIIEGNYTNKSLPSYFEGLKSIGENEENKINISSYGKNLVDNNIINWESGSIDGQDGRLVENNARIRIKNLMELPVKHGYLSAKYFGDYKLAIRFYRKDKTIINGMNKPFLGFMSEGKMEIPNGAYYYTLVCAAKLDTNAISPHEINKCKCQIEIGESEPSQLTPYKINKKEILLNEPLRGVGDVKDTIEKVNGEWKIIRRCKEVIINGNSKENWQIVAASGEKTFRADLKTFLLDSKRISRNKIVCDSFPVAYDNSSDWEHIRNSISEYYESLVFFIDKKKLSSNDLQGVRNYLSLNPTRVIYELETPVIEDISPITLQCWKDGTISIDEILPVESTHTVALNKPAQIQGNIEELTSLRNRVQRLEEQYNSTVLTQAYETILLNFDMNL